MSFASIIFMVSLAAFVCIGYVALAAGMMGALADRRWLKAAALLVGIILLISATIWVVTK